MKNLKYIYFISLTIFLTSCGDNFLEKEPFGLSTFWNTSEDAELGVNAAYEPYLYEEMYGRGIFWLSTASNDFVVNKNKTDVINLTSFLTNSNQAGYCSSYWSDFYKIIRRCNDVITNVPNIDMSDRLKDRILGEANFLMAFNYFQLVQKYGGVPFYDIETPEETNLPRKTLEESYTNIENYLKEAIRLLPDWEYSGDEVGRPHLGSAWGMLAKVYAHEGKWQLSKDASDAVINSQRYSLLSNYGDVFSLDHENSSEHLFSIQCNGNRHSGTITSVVMLPGSVTDGQGWNYFAPTASLANAFEDGDTRKAATLVDINGGILRYDAEDITLSKDLVGGSWTTDYICVKYTTPYKEGYNGWESGLNVPVLRYSDVLLLNAEAIIMLNNGGPSNRDLGVAAAAESFNKVRVRAFGGDQTKAIASPSFNDLVKERRCELAFEEQRHYDLVRWGLAEEIYKAGIDDPRGSRNFDPSKNNVFPLPQVEIDNSNGVLKQNPLY